MDLPLACYLAWVLDFFLVTPQMLTFLLKYVKN